jgi:hypothetical protein
VYYLIYERVRNAFSAQSTLATVHIEPSSRMNNKLIIVSTLISGFHHDVDEIFALLRGCCVVGISIGVTLASVLLL